MTTNQKKWVVRAGAGVVVVAVIFGLSQLVWATPLILVWVAGLGLLVLIALKVRANRKTKVIFRFYVEANDILRDGDRGRYHFEIAGVIKLGQRVVKSMPDAPPLSRFALGALAYSINDYNGAAEQLGFAAEEEVLKESEHLAPSRQLRRYVSKLRKIERRPRRYAKINAAIASLERMHHERAARLLAESQKQLKRMVEAYEGALAEPADLPRSGLPISSLRSLKSITAPPTISEVLNDVYQEEPLI
jgi:hypothetical protein